MDTTLDFPPKAALAAFKDAKLGARLKMWLSLCASCGLCAKACHFYQSDPKPEHVPAYRLKPLMEALSKGDDLTEADVQRIVDVDFGTCTMCRRCAMYCPFGINIGFLVRAARSLAVAMGKCPEGLANGMANALEYGNNLAMTVDEYVETIEWQLEELQEEMPDAVAPLDKVGAEYLITFHPRDIKFHPGNLYSYLKIYNAAGLDFTLTTEGWDSTNIGLFAGDDAAAKTFVGRVVNAARRLKTPKVVTAE